MFVTKEQSSIGNILWLVTFLLSSWTVFWSLRDFNFGLLRYFTIQSNIMVLIVMILYYTMKEDKPYFKTLTTVTNFNIILTGVVFHTMLSQFKGSFLVELQHTLVPIFYVLFYYIVIKEGVELKRFWIQLIYPTVYFVLFIIIGWITSWYPYPFMNMGMVGAKMVFTTILLYMLPGMVMLAFLLTFAKQSLLRGEKVIEIT